MGEVFRSTLRARGLRPASLALAGILVATALLLGWLDGGSSMAVILFASIIAVGVNAGLIGNDVSDGTVQLVLARALTRNEYLAGRFLGAVVLALTGGALVLGASLVGPLLHGGPRRPTGPELAAHALLLAAHLLWQTALCFALSTLAPGRGDVLVYLVLLLASQLLASQADDVSWPWLASAFHWLAAQTLNTLSYSGSAPVFWRDLVRWLSNGAVVLLAGVLVFRRREFSYGSN